MKERRSLVEGLNVDPQQKKLEEAFVFGKSQLSQQSTASAPTVVEMSKEPEEAATPKKLDRSVLPQMTGRTPVTTRCRPEVASALKRASLERQLNGIAPFHIQDIMEDALEQWLKANGYV